MNLAFKIKRNLKWRFTPARLNSGNLIVHFGYHKAMTSYFNKVFNHLAIEFNWHHKHHNSSPENFYNDISNINKTSIISVNNSFIDLNKINTPFKGSYIIRDPRDLIISGYKYHKWTNEPWANLPLTDVLLARIKYDEIKNLDISLQALKKITYKELLNQVDQETGFMIEFNFRSKHFDVMKQQSAFQHPDIKQLKYENLFNNEVAIFNDLFDHYGFTNKMKKSGLNYVEQFSFKNMVKKGDTGNKKHASTGKSAQWKEALPETIKNAFKNEYGQMLIDLNYEKDHNWQ
jgi:hypothetical protein